MNSFNGRNGGALQSILLVVLMLALSSLACTQSASTPPPATEAEEASSTPNVTKTMEVELRNSETAWWATETKVQSLTETATAAVTIEPTQTPTRTPSMTPEPTEEPLVIIDIDSHPNLEDIRFVVKNGALETKEECEVGILTGEVFCPDDRVTRGEQAMAMCNAMYEPGSIPEATNTFKDKELEDQPELAACLEQLLRDQFIDRSEVPFYHPGRYVRYKDYWKYFMQGVYGGAWEPPEATGLYANCPVGYWYSADCEAFINEGYYDKSLGPPYPERYTNRAEEAVMIRVYIEEQGNSGK